MLTGFGMIRICTSREIVFGLRGVTAFLIAHGVDFFAEEIRTGNFSFMNRLYVYTRTCLFIYVCVHVYLCIYECVRVYHKPDGKIDYFQINCTEMNKRYFLAVY